MECIFQRNMRVYLNFWKVTALQVPRSEIVHSTEASAVIPKLN